MDNRIIYISYATKDTPYLEVVNEFLLPSLKRFNLPYDIAYPENRGSWVKNTHMKAEIIKEMLLKHKQPIVFLDADATIHSYPAIFDTLENYDIAYHSLDWNYYWHDRIGREKRDLLSGTLYLNYNEIVLNLLDKWIKLNSELDRWEQRNLQDIIEKNKKDYRIFELPIQYAAIIKMDNKVPAFIQNPIIVHHQKSRIYRKEIK